MLQNEVSISKLKPEVSLSDLPEMVRIHVSIEVLRDSN